MATLSLSIQEMVQYLRDRGRSWEDFKRHLPLKQIAIISRSGVQEHFQRGAGPDGRAWAPIKPRLRGGTKPLLDTGVMRNSITSRVEGDNAVVVWTNKIQGPLQHFGGVITPKRRRFLAVPLTLQALRAGGPRMYPVRLFAEMGPNGGVLIERRTVKRKVVEIKQYALLKRVTIPARPFMGFSDETVEKVNGVLRVTITRYFQLGRARDHG